MLGPLALLSVGAQLSLDMIPDFRWEIAATLVFKTILVPLVLLNVFVLCQWQLTPAIMVALLQASMPPAISMSILLATQGYSSRLVAAVTGACAVFFLFVVAPLVLYLLPR